MHKIKTPALLLIAIFLIGGVLTSATAQKRMSPKPFQPPVIVGLSGSYKIGVAADIISTGEVEFRTASTYGWTCYGTTQGDLTGYLFISLNASAPVSQPDGSEVKTVTSGSWSKLIFDNGVYAGSINGKIVGGQMVSQGGMVSYEPALTTINLQLIGEGGTETYANNSGTGTFDGVLDPAARGAKVYGTLNLNY